MDYYIITYDIREDNRRNKIFKLLKGYVTPVQFSVFEGYVRREDVVLLQHQIRKLIHNRDDSVCFYRQCARCMDQIERLGVNIAVYGKEDIII